MLNTKNMLIFVVLSAGMLTALTATTMMSLAVPVFAGGDDHHDNGDKKKCKDNDNNNCNDTHKTQKIEEKNKCKIENENKDHSKKNDNDNELACVNEATNVKDSEIIAVQENPIPEGCPSDTLYSVTLQEGLSKDLQAGTVLCLNKKLGAQDAFALVNGGIVVGVVVSQPNGGCSPPFVEADVTGGIGPNGATSVCVKLGT